MCVNEYVSMAVFIICTALCIYLYKRNNVNDRWIASLFLFVGTMQLLEFVMWMDQECNGANQLATDIAFWQNILQPIVAIIAAYVFTKGQIPIYIYIPTIVYLFFSIPIIMNTKQPDKCTKTCEGSNVGLAWEYTNTKHLNLVWLIFLIALVTPFFTMPENAIVYTAILIITYIISLFISKFRCANTNVVPTSGSWWCLLAFTTPLAAVFVNKTKI